MRKPFFTQRLDSSLQVLVAVLCASLVVSVMVIWLGGCSHLTPTLSPIPSPSPSVLMDGQSASQVAGLVAVSRATAARLYTGTSYLNWDTPTMANGWAAVWADAPLTYTFVHQWRVVDGDTIVAQGTTPNVLASHLPTDAPGTGRFNGPLAWTMDLGLFTGRASLWEKGCWTATSCPLTATVVLSYPTYTTEEMVGECPDVCMINVPDPGIPLAQDEEGYWLTAYITGEALPRKMYLPIIVTKGG